MGIPSLPLSRPEKGSVKTGPPAYGEVDEDGASATASLQACLPDIELVDGRRGAECSLKKRSGNGRWSNGGR